MSYRDDVDTLYTRAMILQRELDAAKAEVAELRQAGGRPRADTSPGLRMLRELPDPDEVLGRLVDTSRRESGDQAKLRVAPVPMPDWSAIATAPTTYAVPSYLEDARDRLARLLPEDLELIAKLVTELTDGRPGMDDQIRARLRWLASEIALLEK